MTHCYHNITYMTHHYDHFYNCRTLVTSLEADMTQCWGCQVNTRCATVSDTILQTAAAMATTTWAITIRQGEYFTQILQKKEDKKAGSESSVCSFYCSKWTFFFYAFSSQYSVHLYSTLQVYTYTVLCKCTHMLYCASVQNCFLVKYSALAPGFLHQHQPSQRDGALSHQI